LNLASGQTMQGDFSITSTLKEGKKWRVTVLKMVSGKR